MTRFVVLSSQRSGSTWVVDTLASHPRITAYDELLASGGRAARALRWGSSGQEPWEEYARRTRRASLTRYLDGVYATAGAGDAMGFKLMHSHVKRHPAVLAYLRRRRVKVVHLLRSNLLDRLISAEAMRRTGVSRTSAAEPVEPLHLDPATIVRRLRRMERPVAAARRAVRLLRLEAIEVEYDDLVGDPDRFDAIVGFLVPGDRTPALASSLEKLVTAGHPAVIANYEEVAATLAGTRFARMLRP